MLKVKTKSKIENKVKNTKDSIAIDLLSNVGGPEIFMCPDSERLFPERDSWRKRLIYTMHFWSFKLDSLEWQQFYDEYKVTYDSMQKMRLRFEDVAAAFLECSRRIAARKRIGSAYNKLNITVFKDMHRYDPEWLPLMKQSEDIKKDSGQNTRQVVVIEKFSSDSNDNEENNV